MKFTVLDNRLHDERQFSSSKYQYLDDLLEKTFVTDYFLDRSVVPSSSNVHAPEQSKS